MERINYRRPFTVGLIPRDRDVVIEANAGTGKTYTIEHLVADLLLRTESSIEQLLVVTFTEKAAEELRSRIRSLLEQILSRSPAGLSDDSGELVEIDEVQQDKIERALFSFDAASICTIHAFCRRVLNDFAFDAGSAPGAQLVDANRVFHRAFRAQLREVFAVDSASRELLEEWMANGDTARHPTLIESLEDLLRQCHFNRYLQGDAPEINRRAVTELANVFDASLLKKLCARKRRAVDVSAIGKIEELNTILRTHRASPQDLKAALATFHFEGLSYRGERDQPNEQRLIAALEHARAACSLEARVVDAFLPSVIERLRLDKRNLNEIDYSDMLEWLWEALQGSRGESLAGLLRSRFRYALVDEFQDTDDLQWKIFRRLFIEGKNTNTLFVVGDPKQAIYSFRGADVFTYLKAKREILTSGGGLIRLQENYRSTSELLEATNIILDHQAKSPLLSGLGSEDASATCGRKDLSACHLGRRPVVPVTLLTYRPVGGPGAASRMRASIGRYISSTIRKMLFAPDDRIVIKAIEGERQVEAKDIFVLTRTGAEAVEIGGYLREQGVPFAFYKKEGLFQTAEAYDVLDVLKAIEEPESHSKKLKAWVTPFFAVPYPDLFDLGETSPEHPANQRLREWSLLAGEEQFGALFDQLTHRSGLAARELFSANSPRELTNYLHIFELLLGQAHAEQLSLREIIVRLESFADGSALPADVESNIQRLESDRSAVQLMTVHMSKGLQADVVFLFGGTARPPMQPRVCVYHDDAGERRLAIGDDGRTAAKQALEREARAENERLAYVAITRARAKLYLPIYPKGSTKRTVNGYYEALNNRLLDLSAASGNDDKVTRLFERAEVHESDYNASAVSAAVKRKVINWSPPGGLIEAFSDDRAAKILERLRIRSRPMLTRSYTSLESRGSERGAEADIDLREFKTDVEISADDSDLKGGRRVGIFLHEVLEKLDSSSFQEAESLIEWRQREDVVRTFRDAMRRNQVDSRWFERGTEIVFNALTSGISVAENKLLGPLYERDSIREMEFAFPIPEHAQPLLETGSANTWIARRGYLKGFVDLIFQHDGLYYFADWKSDFLHAYSRDALKSHVDERYALQAQIYSIGVVRLLGIRNKADYDDRFGGLLYLFLRGMAREFPRNGVYFHRPDWAEVCSYERALVRVVPESGLPK